jgi:putative endonuclease
MPFVYILRCADDSFYVGSTRNLEARMFQHSTGKGSLYTSTRLPVELVFIEEFNNVGDAYAREKQLQGWGRAKRQKLIEQNYEALPLLARKLFKG